MIKILILLLYYDRPNMVKNALNSIKNLEYDNWELAFIDDGSKKPADDIVKTILQEHLSKIKIYHTNDNIDTKIKNNGSRIGYFMNLAISESTADVGIMLCDDDALVPDYFTHLNNWFAANPNKVYGFCNVILFDPFNEKPSANFVTDFIISPDPKVLPKYKKINRYRNFMNKEVIQVKPMACLDASQVAWRLRVHKEKDIKFPSPQTSSLDFTFYTSLFKNYSYCHFMNCTGQYKGLYNNTLTHRKPEERYLPKDLPNDKL